MRHLRFQSRFSMPAAMPVLIVCTTLAFGGAARADQTSTGTPLSGVVEETPPRDIGSYTLIEVLNTRDPQLLRTALDAHPALIRARFENGMTALEIASQMGYEEGVSVLLGYGADVDAVDDFGHTAVWYGLTAKVPDTYPVVNLLCVHHANLFWYDVNGDFLFDIAVRLNNPRVIECFRNYKAPTRVLYPDARAREAAHHVFIAESHDRVVRKVAPRTVVRVEPRSEPRREVVVAPHIDARREEPAHVEVRREEPAHADVRREEPAHPEVRRDEPPHGDVHR